MPILLRQKLHIAGLEWNPGLRGERYK